MAAKKYRWPGAVGVDANGNIWMSPFEVRARTGETLHGRPDRWEKIVIGTGVCHHCDRRFSFNAARPVKGKFCSIACGARSAAAGINARRVARS